MKINFKKPKYILPLVALPFFCIFFYAFRSGFSSPKKEVKQQAGLNGSVGDVSADVRKKELTDKLDAYRNTYKEADGMSAVNAVPTEKSGDPAYRNTNPDKDTRTLDSINQAMKQRFYSPVPVARPAIRGTNDDQALAKALSTMRQRQPNQQIPQAPNAREKEPMELFKQQMAYMDSISRENDPAYKAEKQKKQAADKQARERAAEVIFPVKKATADDSGFNTVRPQNDEEFIKAIIDENETGYAGSRLRLRLLDGILAGGYYVPKGTLIYALISGFSQQRVSLVIQSILIAGKILPVKLTVYDMDGLPGLYVPSSAFRDFTKNLSGNTMQGISIDGSSNGSQFVMSTASKLFESTSTAITELIRKNKAKLKYNTFIYLIDNDALQNAQKHDSFQNLNETGKLTETP